MAIIDTSGLTMNPQEQDSMRAFVFDLVRDYAPLGTLHDINNGVVMKEQIGIVSRMSKSGVKQAYGSCAMPSSGAGITLTEKFWEPAKIADRLEVCPETMGQLFKGYFSQVKTMRERYDLSQASDVFIVLGVAIAEAMLAGQWRSIWHGDSAIAEAGVAAPGLLSADDVKFYDYFDGIWVQIFAGVTAGDIQHVAIAENALASNTLRTTLAAGRATEILRSMRKKASPELRASRDGVFIVTRWLFDAYVEERQKVSDAFMPSRTEDGWQQVSFDGVPLISSELIDIKYFADYVEDTTDDLYFRPLRALYTTRRNIPIATLETDALAKFKYWFSDKDNMGYIDYAYTLDAKLILENEAVAAY